jgi:hypothetical protein
MDANYAELRERLDAMEERNRHRHRHRHHHPHSGVTPHHEPHHEHEDEEFPIHDAPIVESPPYTSRPYPIHTDNRTTSDNRVTNQDNRSYHSHVEPAPAPQSGGVAHALRVILNAVNGLPDRRQRAMVLGHAIARLVEQQRIKGLEDVVAVALSEANRYAYISDEIARPSGNWHPTH